MREQSTTAADADGRFSSASELSEQIYGTSIETSPAHRPQCVTRIGMIDAKTPRLSSRVTAEALVVG
ncbi:hypothetical protein [Sphingomonas limnosediminicola]|uniref:hypothetical protein n=1 Tax=Sphingomonas limnosediminicola TaxID=940133 RepID=UPI0031CE3F9B